jgi:glycosyltransferase involved in cell wall biosynthesis/Tfp pilus assembly protein PilF
MKKIFIGFTNIASMITDYKMGFEALGLRAITAVYQSSPIQHTVVDYNFSELIAKIDVAASQETGHKDRNEPAKKLKRQIWERSLRECDVFIFIWNSFLPDFSDYAELKKRGKKIVTFFVGNDIRWIPAMEQEFAKYNLPKKDYDDSYRMVPLINKLNYLRTAEKYSDLITSHPGMSQLALRPYFSSGMPLWLRKFRENNNQRRIPKIIHAPSNRAIKGTKYVLDVFEALKREGLEFETELIENLPNLEAIKKYEDADILVGQLFSTYGGRQELEALACGSIVLSGFRPDYAQDYINKNSQYCQKLKEYPLVSVDPNSLYHELKNIILDYPRRVEIAKKGRPYVEKYHDATKLARRTLELLEQDHAEPDFYPTFFRNEFIPESNDTAIYNHYNEMVKECNWYKSNVTPGERCGLIFPDPTLSVSTSTSPRKAGAPIKLLYLAFLYAAEKQIFSKIAQQFRVVKELNPDSNCYIIGTNSGKIPMERYGLNFIDLIETKDNPSRQDYFSACEQIILKSAPDIIYFRYPIFDYWTYEFVSKFNNVVFEHQTIAEYEFHPQLAEMEKKYGPYVLGKAKGIVGVTEEILKYEQARSLAPKPGYVMANGIDNSLPMAKATYPFDEIHLFSTAYFSPWHGLDRLIEGLAHYKEHAKIKLHLIGYGREIPRYQEMIKRYDLEKNVFFHGFLDQEQIGAIAERCQIGVGALGVHRKGLTQSVALKNREYCLRGIPFVYAGGDADFHPDLPFLKVFPADDTPIDIQAIVDFSEQISKHPEIRIQERQYALDNLIWDKKIPGLVQFLTELAQEPAVDFSPTDVPKPVEYYVGKINQALQRQDVELADQISETAVSEYAFQPYLWFMRGSVLRRAGKYQEAISALEHSIESPEALFELLYVYRLLNQAENADKIKEDLVQKYPHWQEKVAQLLIDTEERSKLRITYLISSILGVTGGNITLLNQVNVLSERGHHVTIVTYTDKPQWIDIKARIIRVPRTQPMAPYVPVSHAVISTYFSNTAELVNIEAPVKIYYAQGDQYIFEDDTPSPNPQVEQQRRRMRRLSKASYLYPNVHFVPNSRNLADAVERAYGKKPEAILPVCTDQRIFRPLQKPVVGSKWRILIVGPDRRGSDTEPLAFKGIADIRKALDKLSKRFNNFTAIRMSNTEPDIFKDFPCEYYFCPSDELKTFLYGTAHILVYASHYDSCPRPPQEAMAAGTAVICTATPGAMEYCRDDENCLLVPIKTPEAIADAVDHLIKDGSLRERLVKGGFATARDFPCEREWNELEALLYRFMEESGKGSEGAKILSDKDDADLYQNIQSLIDSSQSNEAINALKELLILRPDFALAHNDLGVLYVDKGEKEKARNHYEQAVRLQPENITFQKNLADFYYVILGLVEDALRIYLNIMEVQPRDTETLLILGHINASLKKLDDAKVFYDRVLEIDTGNMDARQSLDKIISSHSDQRDIVADEGNYDKSQQFDGQCIVVDKKNILASIIIPASRNQKYIKRCVESIKKHTPETHEIVFVDNGCKGALLKWIRQAVKRKSNYRMIKGEKNAGLGGCFNVGMDASSGEYIVILRDNVIVADGWLNGMLKCIKSANDIGIVGPMTNAKAAGIQCAADSDHLKIGQFEKFAGAFLERNRHRRVPLRQVAGFCMFFRRSLVEQIGPFDEELEEGCESDDYCVRAALEGYKNLIAGDVFVLCGDLPPQGNKRSFKHKWRGIDVKSHEGKKRGVLNAITDAEGLYQREEVDKAIVTLIDGIKYRPGKEAIYHLLAEMLIDCERFKEGLDTINSIPEDRGDSARTLELTGYCKAGLELYDEAARFADRALSRNGSSAPALNLIGVLAHRRGDKSASEDFFKGAIASDPGYGEAYTNLGILAWEAERKDDALELLEKGFILSSTVSNSITAYHSAISETAEFERAVCVFREAKALYPQSRRIAFLLIDILIRQEKNESAMQDIHKVMITFGINDAILSAAKAVLDRFDAQKAKDTGERPGLSLCMIVKDEENCLARCLLSAMPVVGEMVIVDTGSTDRTKEIAKTFGARVYDFEWTGDFSEARNLSLSEATGNWILVLDADETISPLDYDRLTKIVKGNTDHPAAYSIITRNYVRPTYIIGWTCNDGQYAEEEAGTGWYPSPKVRLFTNDNRIRFENPVHEIVEHSLKRHGIKIRKCDIPVHHYGQLDTDHYDAKSEAYYLLGKKKLEEEGENLKTLIELAVQAEGKLGKYEEAVDLWKRVLKIDPGNKKALLNMGCTCFKLEKYEPARTSSKIVMELDPGLKEAVIIYTTCEVLIGDMEKTIPILENLLKKVPEYPLAIAVLAAVYGMGDDKEKGLEHIQYLMKMGFLCAEYLHNLSERLVSVDKNDSAVSLLEFAVESGNGTREIRELLDSLLVG